MKSSTLLLLLLFSPATAFASGELVSTVPIDVVAKNKAPSVMGQVGPCASPDKMLRDACMKRPDTSASRASVGSETVQRVTPEQAAAKGDLIRTPDKLVKITPRVKPADRSVTDSQKKPIIKPGDPKKGVKTSEMSGSARHKPGLGFKG